MTSHTFEGRAAGPHLLITAGVHGDEFEPMAAVAQLADRLDHLLRNGPGFLGRVTLVPVVNEAAYDLGTRVAEDGLDLARTCPGRPDGRPTERVAHALSELIASSDAYVDLHTGGRNLALLPLAGYLLHPDPTVLDRQRRMAAAFGLPLVWGTSTDLDGRSLSIARDARIPAIYCESGGGTSWNPETLSLYVDGCLNLTCELGMTDGRSVALPPPLVIEDDRPGSGHLQVQNPSPASGLFRSVVKLGDPVGEGDLLGTVSDPIGRTNHPAFARQEGIVIALRVFPRVDRGDCLGVILEQPTTQ